MRRPDGEGDEDQREEDRVQGPKSLRGEAITAMLVDLSESGKGPFDSRQATLRAIACRQAGGRWKTRLKLGEES
jgi:hypothetical protein